MIKPAIFFSHSSQDQKQLIRLKELFVKKTGGSIEVFLSSDGESIPLGRNWVHKIEEALAKASLMIVFVTPASLKSTWLYFESGYAYSKDIRVVPVGFLGIDLSSVPAPLNLLQGFNITSESGLNNIIAVANDACKHTHAESFSADEYHAICSTNAFGSNSQLGKHAPLLNHIMIGIEEEDLLCADAERALNEIASTFTLQHREHDLSNYTLTTKGITFYVESNRKPECLGIDLDPSIANVALPVVGNVLRGIRQEGLVGVILEAEFVEGIFYLHQRHKLTGKLYGTKVDLAPDNWLRYENLEFSFGSSYPFIFGKPQGAIRTCLKIRLLTDQIDLQELQRLLDLLFEQQILYFRS